MDERTGQFLNFLAVEKNASNNTIAAYRNDLSQFLGFVAEQAPGRASESGVERHDDPPSVVAHAPLGAPGWMKPGAGAPAGARRIGGTREGRRIHSGDRAARGQEPEGVS